MLATRRQRKVDENTNAEVVIDVRSEGGAIKESTIVVCVWLGCDIDQELQHNKEKVRNGLGPGAWRISGEEGGGSSNWPNRTALEPKEGLVVFCKDVLAASRPRPILLQTDTHREWFPVVPSTASHLFAVCCLCTATLKSNERCFRLRHGNSATGSPLTLPPAPLPVSGTEQQEQRSPDRDTAADLAHEIG
jgi:hypothetical protein